MLSTRYVGGDFGEGRLAEALGGAGADRDQVGGPGVEVGKHVVGFIPQFGDGSPRTRYVNTRI